MEVRPSLLFAGTAVIAGLLLANGFLIHGVSRRNRDVEGLRASLRSRAQPSIGRIVPAFDAVLVNGTQIRAEFHRYERTLLLAFDADCAACEANWPRWTQLTATLAPGVTRVIFVDITGRAGSDYLKRHELSEADVIKYVSPGIVNYLRLGAAPQSVVLDSVGRVLGVWSGVLTPPLFAQLSDCLVLRDP